ncbi:hypothetical protein H696_04654 [Fonticula alba]|uniref:Uncharacterized protein n=1 Tax=Fonticula alba TaxID=691883 RepID=A0A058Z6S2_FONAL|nr:hypothetical protein H696_04654 [Fonticula alba]KCV69237.1 hypothetical protein H696_04654 [Fonticula alba]|eukprot:XP_009496808.1 hypothetical protein H696_04654 [Fonticula alba]
MSTTRSSLLLAVVVAVIALLAMSQPGAALTNDVYTNGRRLSDNSEFRAQLTNRVVPLNPIISEGRRCFIDSGRTSGPVTVASGYLYEAQGANVCCKERGKIIRSDGHLLCRYNIADTDQYKNTNFYVAQYNAVDSDCLSECFGMGGCDKCLGEWKITCEQFCRSPFGGGYDSGRCGYPGSRDPNRCCECTFYANNLW